MDVDIDRVSGSYGVGMGSKARVVSVSIVGFSLAGPHEWKLELGDIQPLFVRRARAAHGCLPGPGLRRIGTVCGILVFSWVGVRGQRAICHCCVCACACH